MGVCLNAIKQGVKIETSTKRFETQIQRFIDQGKAPSTTHLFPTRISHSVAVGRSVMQGLPMVLLSKGEASVNVAEDYIMTAQYIEKLLSPTGAIARAAAK